MTSRQEAVNYSYAGNLHFYRISSLRERKYKRRFQPNVVFYSFYLFFLQATYKDSQFWSHHPQGFIMQREKPVGGIKIILVSLQVFFNVSLQTPCTVTLLNESPRPNWTTNKTILWYFFQLLQLLLAISLWTEAADYIQTPRGNHYISNMSASVYYFAGRNARHLDFPYCNLLVLLSRWLCWSWLCYNSLKNAVYSWKLSFCI